MRMELGSAPLHILKLDRIKLVCALNKPVV
jgi:hypothetical protein